jgi:hypothetical protein
MDIGLSARSSGRVKRLHGCALRRPAPDAGWPHYISALYIISYRDRARLMSGQYGYLSDLSGSNPSGVGQRGEETLARGPVNDGRVYSRTEQSQLRASARQGGAVKCPRCAQQVSRRPVPAVPGVAYVRTRAWWLCEGCGCGAVLDVERS